MNVKEMAGYLAGYDGAPVRIMEVCGTHTTAIVRSGLRGMLSPKIELISGPGCPVCVTVDGYIDALCGLARDGAAVCSFGDMLKVPGSEASLAQARSCGADVRVLYSPFEMLRLAQEEPGREFVFTAVGFETIAPVYALLAEKIRGMGISNAKLLTALKRMPPVLERLCREDIDGFLAPGHVAAVTGSDVFAPLAQRHRKPFCVAGFDEEQIIAGVYDLVRQRQDETWRVDNVYRNVVTERGNLKAKRAMDAAFEEGGAAWRGIGEVAGSGLYLRDRELDAGSRAASRMARERRGCRCGEMIVGHAKPVDCPLFGGACTPSTPLGPCMVSGEGVCGIWYQCGVRE